MKPGLISKLNMKLILTRFVTLLAVIDRVWTRFFFFLPGKVSVEIKSVGAGFGVNGL